MYGIVVDCLVSVAVVTGRMLKRLQLRCQPSSQLLQLSPSSAWLGRHQTNTCTTYFLISRQWSQTTTSCPTHNNG